MIGFAIAGYIAYVVITLWVCAASIFVALFDGNGKGGVSTEGKVFLAIAAAMAYGAYHFFPFTVGMK